LGRRTASGRYAEDIGRAAEGYFCRLGSRLAGHDTTDRDVRRFPVGEVGIDLRQGRGANFADCELMISVDQRTLKTSMRHISLLNRRGVASGRVRARTAEGPVTGRCFLFGVAPKGSRKSPRRIHRIFHPAPHRRCGL
jgi:hypothetical protein